MQIKNPSLTFCILMDAIGYFSYALPFLGEFTDILWAPLSMFIFYKSFGGKDGLAGSIFQGLEELFPGLDFIPSFTIMFAIRKMAVKQTNPHQVRV